jgi:hypothetical protein
LTHEREPMQPPVALELGMERDAHRSPLSHHHGNPNRPFGSSRILYLPEHLDAWSDAHG